MMSPLEYLFFAMMSTQSPDVAAISNIHHIEPATGSSMESRKIMTGESGFFELRTILVQPHNELEKKLEAPMRITPEWIPSFAIGAPVTITIDKTGKTYPAHINRIVSITDADGVTIQVIAVLNHPAEELKPGMTALATMDAPASVMQ